MSLYTLTERFGKSIGYDVSTLLNDYVLFISTDSDPIMAYLGGTSTIQPTSSFNALKSLKNRFYDCYTNIRGRIDKIDGNEFFDVVEAIEDAMLSLEQLSKYGKFAKTSIRDSGYLAGYSIDDSVHQGQTMEKLVSSYGYSDPDNQWTDVAIQNSMRETAYAVDGSGRIQIPLNGNFNAFVSNGVVDYQGYKSAYGKDIGKKIIFSDGDVKVLEYDDTMLQSAEILSGLKIGDNPEFPEDGINPYMVYNAATAGTAYPSIVRQLTNTFAKDDCFSTVTISEAEVNQV